MIKPFSLKSLGKLSWPDHFYLKSWRLLVIFTPLIQRQSGPLGSLVNPIFRNQKLFLCCFIRRIRILEKIPMKSQWKVNQNKEEKNFKKYSKQITFSKHGIVSTKSSFFIKISSLLEIWFETFKRQKLHETMLHKLSTDIDTHIASISFAHCKAADDQRTIFRSKLFRR